MGEKGVAKWILFRIIICKSKKQHHQGEEDMEDMKKLREEELIQVNGGDGYNSIIERARFKKRDLVYWKGHGEKIYTIHTIYGNKKVGYRYALYEVHDIEVPEGDLSIIPFHDI